MSITRIRKIWKEPNSNREFWQLLLFCNRKAPLQNVSRFLPVDDTTKRKAGRIYIHQMQSCCLFYCKPNNAIQHLNCSVFSKIFRHTQLLHHHEFGVFSNMFEVVVLCQLHSKMIRKSSWRCWVVRAFHFFPAFSIFEPLSDLDYVH